MGGRQLLPEQRRFVVGKRQQQQQRRRRIFLGERREQRFAQQRERVGDRIVFAQFVALVGHQRQRRQRQQFRGVGHLVALLRQQ